VSTDKVLVFPLDDARPNPLLSSSLFPSDPRLDDLRVSLGKEQARRVRSGGAAASSEEWEHVVQDKINAMGRSDGIHADGPYAVEPTGRTIKHGDAIQTKHGEEPFRSTEQLRGPFEYREIDAIVEKGDSKVWLEMKTGTYLKTSGKVGTPEYDLFCERYKEMNRRAKAAGASFMFVSYGEIAAPIKRWFRTEGIGFLEVPFVARPYYH
jgi:hypothetical protein